MTERSKRFHRRINIERSLLSIVNSSKRCRELPLAGLSEGAIREWSHRARLSLPSAFVRQGVDVLMESAAQTGLLADNSRGVFEAISIDGEAHTILRRRIAELFD
jgi:hypothetical protein